MIKKVIFLITLLLITTFIFAQNRYKKGWIVLNSNDTISGEILQEDWNENPTSIKFKLDKVNTYAVADLKAFGLVNEKILFERYSIKMHLLPTTQALEFPDNFDSTTQEIAWIQILISAKVALGEFSNKFREGNYYYYIINGEPTELVYGNGTYNYTTRKIEKYKTQLNELCLKEQISPEVYTLIPKTDYKDESLMNLFLKINNITSTTKVETSKSYFYFGVGVCNYFHSITGSSGSFLDGATFKNSMSTALIISHQYEMLRKYKNVGAFSQLILNRLKTTGTSELTSYGSVNNFEIESTYIDFSSFATYNIAKEKKPKLIVGIGLSIGLRLGGSQTRKRTDYVGEVFTYPNEPAQKTFGIVLPSFLLNYLIKKVSFNLTYQLSSSQTNYSFQSWQMSKLFFTVSYKISK